MRNGEGSPRGLTPRVIQAIAQRVENIVSKKLKSEVDSGGRRCSSEEKDFVATAVRYFLSHHRNVTEPHLADLASILAMQLVERRRLENRNMPAQPPNAACQRESIPEPFSLQKPAEFAQPTSPRLPPIASPRRLLPPPPPAPSSVAPFATSNAVEVQSPRSNQFTKGSLSAALDEQLRQKEEGRKRIQEAKKHELDYRLEQVAEHLDVDERQKHLKKQLNLLLSDEYSHYAKGRDIQEKISKLESNLLNHLERKKVTADAQQHAQAQCHERQRRRNEEKAALQAQLREREELQKHRSHLESIPSTFCIGQPPEEIRAAAERRKKSLAQGLTDQIALRQHTHE